MGRLTRRYHLRSGMFADLEARLSEVGQCVQIMKPAYEGCSRDGEDRAPRQMVRSAGAAGRRRGDARLRVTGDRWQ
jgi:hypothetical protein